MDQKKIIWELFRVESVLKVGYIRLYATPNIRTVGTFFEFLVVVFRGGQEVFVSRLASWPPHWSFFSEAGFI